MLESRWIEGRVTYPVYYEDTDFSGRVYHANYLKYFERGREELVGLDYIRALYERGIHFVVSRISIRYHMAAHHGDTVEIFTRLKLCESPVTRVQQTANRAHDGKKLVEATVKLVAVNSDGRAIRVPKDILDFFRTISRAPTTP